MEAFSLSSRSRLGNMTINLSVARPGCHCADHPQAVLPAVVAGEKARAPADILLPALWASIFLPKLPKTFQYYLELVDPCLGSLANTLFKISGRRHKLGGQAKRSTWTSAPSLIIAPTLHAYAPMPRFPISTECLSIESGIEKAR